MVERRGERGIRCNGKSSKARCGAAVVSDKFGGKYPRAEHPEAPMTAAGSAVFVESSAGVFMCSPSCSPDPTRDRKLVRQFWAVLTLKCERGHTRTAKPRTLAALAGWDALVQAVVKRMR
jgi:hypothetical protein